jgi:hypothetical protein
MACSGVARQLTRPWANPLTKHCCHASRCQSIPLSRRRYASTQASSSAYTDGQHRVSAKVTPLRTDTKHACSFYRPVLKRQIQPYGRFCKRSDLDRLVLVLLRSLLNRKNDGRSISSISFHLRTLLPRQSLTPLAVSCKVWPFCLHHHIITWSNCNR